MISVTIICRNEEKYIERCLKSVMWADEIIVIDAESTDSTREIAAKFTNNVFVKKWEGFVEQRIFALEKTSNEWVLAIDADEVVTEELSKEIIDIVNSNNISETGFKIPRKSFFLNKWIKHSGWYPSAQLRLFRKSKVKLTDRLVHEAYLVEGKVGYLKNDLLHYTVSSISEYMHKVNQYSTLQAIEKKDIRIIKKRNFISTAPLAFFSHYILKKGFLDGINGAMVAVFHSITKILTLMKIWELQNKDKDK